MPKRLKYPQNSNRKKGGGGGGGGGVLSVNEALKAAVLWNSIEEG